MKVFLTGVTGFLGRHVAKELVKRGHGLTCLVRDESQIADLKLIPAQMVKGDIKDYEGIKNAMAGHDAVIHLAAARKFGATDSIGVKNIHDTNVTGTENVMLAAIKMKVDKIVYCGDAAAMAKVQAEINADKKAAQQALAATFPSHYEHSKYLALKKVANFVRQGAPITTVNPSHIYGPDDNGIIGQTIEKHLQGNTLGQTVSLDDADLVHVNDASRGVVDALEKGATGANYVLSGQNVGWEEFLFLLENESGVSKAPLSLGIKSTKLLAYASDIISKLTKKSGKISTESVNHFSRNLVFDNRKTQMELGWIPRPFSQGLKDTIERYKQKLSNV